MVGLVGDREEFHPQCDLDESQHDLRRIELSAALGKFFEHGGEEGESTAGEFWTPIITMLAFSLAFANPYMLARKKPTSGKAPATVSVSLFA